MNPNMTTTFGAALRQFRLAAGLNQRELAAQVGLDFSYISKLENDRLPPPAADTVVALCRVLHIEAEELLALIGKLPSAMSQVVGTNKAALAFLRAAQHMELTDDAWKNLTHTLQERSKSKVYRILITDALSPQALELLNAATDTRFDVVESPSQDDLCARVPEYDALIIRSSVKVNSKVLEAATRLKVIGRAGVGLDNVDIQAASRRGVVVMNTPAANTITTAEHAVTLMLSLCRHVPQAQASILKGEWKRSKFMGAQLHGKTLGIVGLGRIGMHVAHLAQAFGMKVIGVDPYISEATAQERKIALVNLDTLLAQADVITLHTVLTSETRGMINAETIAKMKPGVRLINAARGELVDEAALVAALRSGHIAGAALDTYPQEPLPANSELRSLPNVVLTPHIAASTVEAQDDAGTQVVEQVLGALRGEEYRNAVNMPVDATVFKELRPYLHLAERMGSLQMQLAARPISQVEVEVHGDDIQEHIKPLTVAVLKGMLDAISDTPINYVNALHLALERGIRVTETRGLTPSSYANQVLCRVKWNGGERVVIGSLLGDEAPRVVQIDSFRLDANLEGIILVMESVDRPGVISRVSTLLAANDLNIAEWRLGRTAPGAQVLSFVNLDSPASAPVLAEVKKLEGVVDVTQIYL
jgi:D-3-phosphoglycerate dehydrogenase